MEERYLDNEKIVFALLKRNIGGLRRYSGLLKFLRYMYPSITVESGMMEKVVAFLKRHEDIWINTYRLLGWEIVERYEMDMSEFKRMYEELKRLLETIRDFKNLPDWLGKTLRPTIALGTLPLRRAIVFLELVERRFREYEEIPKVMRRERAREKESRFHKFVRTSQIVALVIGIGDKVGQLKRIRGHLYELLRKGIVPLDYSYNTIIVARRRYRYGFWLSIFNFDPLEILRGFETRYEILVADVRELSFEPRDVGWGLKVLVEP